MLPTVKDHITRQGSDIIEKALAPPQDLAEQGIFGITPLQHGMEQQGEQVEAEQKRRQVLLAMPKVMLQMVALRLEHVVVFVFDFPASAPRLRHLRDVLRRNLVIGDKAIVVELFTRVGVHHRDLAPIDGEGLGPLVEEHVIDKAIQPHFREAAIPVAAFTDGDTIMGLPKGKTLVQLGMGIRFTHKDEVEALVQRQGTKGLLAVEIIAQ